MLDLNKLINNDLDGLSNEEQEYAKEFNKYLRENIIKKLIEKQGSELIAKYKSDIEDYYETLGNILTKGVKGYNNMTLKMLIDTYLTQYDETDFIELLSKFK